MNLRDVIRAWLGGPFADREEMTKDFNLALARIEADNNRQLDTLYQLHHEQQMKFDELCKHLGVTIVSDFIAEVPVPMVVHISEDGILGRTNQEFVRAIELQRQSLIDALQSTLPYTKGKSNG